MSPGVGAETLAAAAVAALGTADAAAKAVCVRCFAAAWRDGEIPEIGTASPPERPARPPLPELRPPRDMPRRGRARSPAGRIALLHALAHIELNAVDLACDIVARFTRENPPRAFYDDWVAVADDEARHFTLLSGRLAAFGASYGDLPAHDGLWQAAEETAHDLLARLAVVPLVLEARGLDVTPAMIESLRKAEDDDSVAVLETVYRDEITHVAAGRRWFDHVCGRRGLEPVAAYHELVRRHFRGALKPPFNEAARAAAGMEPGFYAPLAAV